MFRSKLLVMGAVVLSLFSTPAFADKLTDQIIVDAKKNLPPQMLQQNIEITATKIADPTKSPFDLYQVLYLKDKQPVGQSIIPVVVKDGKAFIVRGSIVDTDKQQDISIIWQAVADKLKESIPADPTHLVHGKQASCTIPIFVFSDYECPYCQTFAPAIEKIVDETPGACLYHYEFPLSFHKSAEYYARISLAWREITGRPISIQFWQTTKDKPTADAWVDAQLKQHKIDSGKFFKMVSSPEIEARIKADMELGSKLGVRGTPSVFVGDYKVPGKPEFVKSIISWIQENAKK